MLSVSQPIGNGSARLAEPIQPDEITALKRKLGSDVALRLAVATAFVPGGAG